MPPLGFGLKGGVMDTRTVSSDFSGLHEEFAIPSF